MIASFYDLCIFQNVLWISIFVSVLAAPELDKLLVTVVQVTDRGAVLTWEGLDVTQVRSCEYSTRDWSNLTGEVPIEMLFLPVNNTIHLDSLAPGTRYNLHLSCEGDQAVHEYQLNFTTAPEGKKFTYAPPADVTSLTPSPPPGTAHRAPGPSPGPVPGEEGGVSREPLPTHAGPVDIALGIVFGLVALAILATVAYYFLKKFRRRQRIRRFLQYRQQENDPFPDIDPDEADESERITF